MQVCVPWVHQLPYVHGFFWGFCSKPQANDLRAHLMWNGKRKCQSEILKLQRAEEEELDKEFCACVQNKHKV